MEASSIIVIFCKDNLSCNFCKDYFIKKLESSFPSIYDIIVLLLFIINWRVLKKGKIVYILVESYFVSVNSYIDRSDENMHRWCSRPTRHFFHRNDQSLPVLNPSWRCNPTIMETYKPITRPRNLRYFDIFANGQFMNWRWLLLLIRRVN